MRSLYAYIRSMTDDERANCADTTGESSNTESVVSLRIPFALNEKIAMAAQAVGLRKADVMRLALDRGIDRLAEQLESPLTTVEP